MVKTVQSEELKSLIDSGTAILLKCGAEWCAPCKAMSPVLETVSTQVSKKIEFLDLDIDENTAFASALSIRGVPTLIIFNNTKEIARKVGTVSPDVLLSWIEENI